MALSQLAYVASDDDGVEEQYTGGVGNDVDASRGLPVGIREVPPGAVEALREHLVPMLDHALAVDGSTELFGETAETVLDDVQTGRRGMLLATQENDILGVVCAQMVIRPNGRWLDITSWTGTRMWRWLRPMIQHLGVIARERGANGVIGGSLRGKGWAAIAARFGGEKVATVTYFRFPIGEEG